MCRGFFGAVGRWLWGLVLGCVVVVYGGWLGVIWWFVVGLKWVVGCDLVVLGLRWVFRRSPLGLHGEAMARQTTSPVARHNGAVIFLWVLSWLIAKKRK
jgi:hypothetical protein